MRFVYQTITDPLQDTQQNFEQLEGIGMLLAGNNLADVANVSRALGTLLGATYAQAGTGTLTWPGGGSFSNNLAIALPGATGAVHAVATPSSEISAFDRGLMAAAPSGSGGVNFSAITRGGGNPPGGSTMTFSYLMWGS